MIDMQTLRQTIRTLTPAELEELKAYIEQIQQTPPPTLKERIFNMHPGAIEISDDFTDPLPDEFWFGK